MSNLIPQKRLDKNGRLVTKHVRTDKPSSKVAGVPAPSLGPAFSTPVLKPFAAGIKLLERQTEPSYQYFSQPAFHPELIEALSQHNIVNTDMNGFRHSDLTKYSVMSVAEPTDALLLINNGYDTDEKALEFLMENGLHELVRDRRSYMEEALKRRIQPTYFIPFMKAHPVEAYDFDKYMDAADANNNMTLRDIDQEHYIADLNAKALKTDSSRPYGRFRDMVLNDEISYADIKTVGATRIAKSKARDGYILLLKDMHQGAVECTAAQLKPIMKTMESDGVYSGPANWTLERIREWGGTYMSGLHSMAFASTAWIELQREDFSEAEQREYISYFDRLRHYEGQTTVWESVRLADAGISPEDAAPLLQAGLTTEQVIATHTEGIKQSLSDGWL